MSTLRLARALSAAALLTGVAVATIGPGLSLAPDGAFCDYFRDANARFDGVAESADGSAGTVTFHVVRVDQSYASSAETPLPTEGGSFRVSYPSYRSTQHRDLEIGEAYDVLAFHGHALGWYSTALDGFGECGESAMTTRADGSPVERPLQHWARQVQTMSWTERAVVGAAAVLPAGLVVLARTWVGWRRRRQREPVGADPTT